MERKIKYICGDCGNVIFRTAKQLSNVEKVLCPKKHSCGHGYSECCGGIMKLDKGS